MAKRIKDLADLPELSTRPELSEFTGVAAQTLARWTTEGTGPKVTKLGSAVRYRKADVIAWIEGAASKASA